jgi:hypothetical protein
MVGRRRGAGLVALFDEAARSEQREGEGGGGRSEAHLVFIGGAALPA